MNNHMPTNWTTQEKQTCFQKHNSPPNLSQEEIYNLNRPITRSETEYVVKKKKIPANKSPEADGFTEEFYQSYQ